MKPHPLLRKAACTIALACAAFAVCGVAAAQSPITHSADVTVARVSRGALLNPRGLKFLDPIQLYVAEGGTGGTNSTEGRCRQVDPPIGPYTGATTGGRVSTFQFDIGPAFRHNVTANIPTSQTSAESGSLVSGASDVAFIGDQLYVLVSGGGCSHGVTRSNVILRVNRFGGSAPVPVANLSAWLRANPGADHPADFEPDGTWFSMVAYNGMLYVVEPNHGLFVRVNPTTGAITRVLDIGGAIGHVVPTVVARHKGYFYIANLGTFPIVDGTQRVWRVLSNPTRLQAVARGTAIVGLAFGPDDAMYILQLTTGAPGPTPGRGSIVRIRPGGGPQTIVDGLTFPMGMTFGGQGNSSLYVSHMGIGTTGEILRVILP